MKGRRKMIIIIIILGMVICCGGIYNFLLKYFFFNKYNIYAQRAVLDRLNQKYNQEFEIVSKEFETKEVKTEGAKYVHIWTYVLRDSQGRQFYAYVRLYGLIDKGDGDFHALDYFNYINDTYEQPCIEKRIISVDGFEVEYNQTSRKVDDIKDIELGSSIQEISDKLGEPDTWIGSGILRPVYFLENNKVVVFHFNYPTACKDLRQVVLISDNGEEQIIKEK